VGGHQLQYKLALIALEQGVDGLRLNPGNIGGKGFVQEVVNVAKEKRIPIRIGVNGGIARRGFLAKHGGPSAEGMSNRRSVTSRSSRT